MSETEERKLDIIDPEAVVSIKISTGYYQKLQELLKFITVGKSPEEIQAAYAQIKDQKITDPWAEQLQTLFIILKEFQEEAHKAGHVMQMTKSEAEEYIKEKFPENTPELKITDDELGKDMDEPKTESEDSKESTD